MNNLLESLPSTSVTIYIDPVASVAPVGTVLGRIFDTEQVRVAERADQSADVIVERDGHVVATSTVTELLRSLLLVNSDIYITGSRRLEDAKLPETLRVLHDIPFQLRGYPDSDSEKLLLIAVSRAIERRAFRVGDGTLHVGFQRLSRLVDEPGTLRVYEQLAETGVAVHAYGVGDVEPPPALNLTVRTGTTGLYRDGWFVVYQPPADGKAVGLYAIDAGDNQWDGFWTYSAGRVKAMATQIADETAG